MIRPKIVILLLLFCSLLIAQPQSSTGVLARAEVDKSKVTIGDKVWLKVLVSAPPGTEVDPIDFTGAMPEIAASNMDIRPRAVVAETPELLLEQRVQIQLFDTGYIFIPEIAIPYRLAGRATDTTKTESLLLTIAGVAITEDDELMPIKPIIKEALNWLDFWPAYLALVILLGGYLAYLWYQRRENTKAVAPPPPPKPPHVIALERLDTLEQKALWQQGEVNPYYTQLSYILRAYLEDRFTIPALESTTKQIDRELTKKQRLTDTQRSELSELLQLSDLVKFARAEPAATLHQRGLDRVRIFVENTVPVLTSDAAATTVSPLTPETEEE